MSSHTTSSNTPADHSPIKRPIILVTNDDGIFADGIRALCKAMLELGDVYVVAPEAEQSAVGHGITVRRPLRFKETIADRFEGMKAYRVDGTPADCVAMGIRLLPLPDLVVSGINMGQNLGDDLTHSGTVSAAIEATHQGIPAIAFSQVFPPADEQFDFSGSAQYATQLVRGLLQQKLPPRTLLSVNFPHGKAKGVRVTKLSNHDYKDNLLERQDPNGSKYYWIDGIPSGDSESDNDLGAVQEGYISVTPIKLDFFAKEYQAALEGWLPKL